MAETAKALYERLAIEREVYIDRAEDCAKYTIPFLFPKKEANGTTKYPTPYQAVGARGVNNLTSKLVLALFPPNTPFFRQDIRDDVLKYYESKPEDKQEIEQALVQREQTAQKYFESSQMRVSMEVCLKQLIIAGNALLFFPPKEGGIKVYKLNSYVVQRDFVGHPIQMITCDKLAINTLPYEVLGQLDIDLSAKRGDELVEVYTHITYSSQDNRYYSYQEIEGKQIDGYEQSFPADVCPWIPVRLFKMDGEHYSRSYVEEYIGDLKTLEGLSKAIAEMSAIAASVIYLVRPNGVTQPSKIMKTKNGGFVTGNKEDVTCLSLDKTQDMQIAKMTADAIESRLSYAFMLNSAVQRSGERVTAEEIRYVANELEDTLGGIYSILSQELQLPLANTLLNILSKKGEIADVPKDIVSLAVTTGMEAIGRGHDQQKLTVFIQGIAQIPDAASVVNWEGVARAWANSCNLDTTGLIKTAEQIQQEQQQAQMMAMAQAAIPNATKGAMDAMNQQTQGGSEDNG